MVTPVLQRTNMVESQVRPSDVTDRRILAAMQEVPRELFAPPEFRALAYMDEALPLTSSAGSRRALMPPRVFAKLLQLLELGHDDNVLDVGAATGYAAAVLSKIAGSVVALESDEALAGQATDILAGLAIGNVAVVRGSLVDGLAEQGPYNAILLEGSVDEVPEAILNQLSPDGRLATVMRGDEGSHAVVWLRTEDSFARRVAFDAVAPPLPGFEKVTTFTF